MPATIKHRCAGALAFTLLFSGCGGDMSTLNPGGEAARALANLSVFIYVVFIAVSLVLALLILWPVFRKRRGNFEEHAPIHIDGGHSWILAGGILTPFIVLSVVFLLGLKTMAAYPLHDGHVPEPAIQVVGHQWWWEIRYVMGPPNLHFKTANEIHLPVGELVDLEVKTADVIHSFWVPRLHGKVDLIPGRANHIRLRADIPGVYRGQCAEFCGAQHAHMSFVVVAESPEEYATWLEAQRQPAADPQTDLASQGRDVFLSKPCSLCHTVRGTLANGLVAPDLTHIGSRRSIAANTYENTKANLMAWVTHAQAMKPEVMMPNVTQMTGQELQALVAYLQELK